MHHPLDAPAWAGLRCSKLLVIRGQTHYGSTTHGNVSGKSRLTDRGWCGRQADGFVYNGLVQWNPGGFATNNYLPHGLSGRHGVLFERPWVWHQIGLRYVNGARCQSLYALRRQRARSLWGRADFVVEDLQAAKQELVRCGCKVIRWEGQGRPFYIEDPFGLKFNLWQD